MNKNSEQALNLVSFKTKDSPVNHLERINEKSLEEIAKLLGVSSKDIQKEDRELWDLYKEKAVLSIEEKEKILRYKLKVKDFGNKLQKRILESITEKFVIRDISL